jgi:hypothetical protein
MILKLFKREESSINDIDFITLAKSSCDQKFYIETLKLKSDEIALFSSFVKPTQIENTLENSTVLSMMDFIDQNIEFKKL